MRLREQIRQICTRLVRDDDTAYTDVTVRLGLHSTQRFFETGRLST